MVNSKVAKILRLLSKDELKSFEKFIQSSYFSIGRNTAGFFSELKKHYPDFNSPLMEKEKIFQTLFPDEKYNEKKIKNLSSDLIRHSEQFLIYEYLKNEDAESKRILALQYKAKKSRKFFFKTLNTLDNILSTKEFNSIDSFRMEEEVERLNAEYYMDQQDFDSYIRSWQKYSEHLTASFLIRYFRKLRDKFILSEGYNAEFQNPLFDSISESIDFEKMMSFLRKKKYDNLWLIEIYYCIYKCTYDVRDDKHFIQLKKTFYANIDNFSRLEKTYIFNDMIDYWVMRKEIFHKNFQEEIFDLYKDQLKNNAYQRDNEKYMSIVLYRNIMIEALSLGKFEWLTEFVEKYSSALDPEYRDNMMYLAKANLCFENGRFEEALEYVGKVQYDFFMYKLDIKNLTLRIFYELELYEQAYSLLDAYRHFLSNTDEIAPAFKVLHNNFLHFYSKLLKIKSMGIDEDTGLYIREMNKIEIFASKKWLLKKAKELLKKS